MTALLLLLAAAQEVENDSPKFRFRLPPGYAPNSEVQASRYYLKEDRGRRFVLTVSILPGPTAPGDIHRRQAELTEEVVKLFPGPPPAGTSIRRFPWKGRSIEVLDVRAVQAGAPLVAAMAFLPTVPTSVRIEVLGPAGLEPDVTADLLRVLASFEAETDWTTPEQEDFLRASRWMMAASILGAPVYILAWLLFFRRRPWRLLWVRVGWMLAMAGLMLAPAASWSSWMSDVVHPRPTLATWPAPLFLAAPWLMLASVRAAARFLLTRAQIAEASALR